MAQAITQKLQQLKKLLQFSSRYPLPSRRIVFPVFFH